MKALMRFGTISTVLFLVAGCSAWPRAGNNGLFYTKVSTPVAAFQNARSEPLLYGQACNSGILGLVVYGDSSIAAARENGSINETVTVEEHFKHVLFGAYSQYCTVVGGY